MLNNNFGENLIAGTNESSEIQNPLFGPELKNIYSSGPTGFLSIFLPNLIGLAFVIGTVIFFFMLIVGSTQWISSGGDKAALEGARSKLTNALIGIILLFASFAIMRLIETFFGINILTIDIGPLIIQ